MAVLRILGRKNVGVFEDVGNYLCLDKMLVAWLLFSSNDCVRAGW